MYRVYVTIKFGIDDTYYCEYSGIDHATYHSANIEKEQALMDDGVLSANIEYIDSTGWDDIQPNVRNDIFL